jgi:GNAT superfamily N-acetyltransferase
MSLNLRLAQDKDRESFINMGSLFHQAGPYSNLPYSREKIGAIFDHRDSNTLLLFLVDGDAPVGMLLGTVTEPYFSEDKVATELAWWVNPEYRRTKKSIELTLAFEDWAYRMGAKVVALASLDTSPASVGKFYESMGFKKREETYLRSFD